MKKILPLLFATMLSNFSLEAVAQNFENAGEYLAFIGKQQQEVSKKFLAYSSASAHGKRQRKVEALREKLLNQIQESRMNISGMPSFNGDKSYRDSSVNFMKFYFNVMNDDYTRIINMEEIAEKSFDGMEAYLMMEEKVGEKLKEANERMHQSLLAFGAKNNIRITEDKSELGKMMSEVGENNKYYHAIYLIFFKPNIQESNMMDALNSQNLTGVEQSRGSMLKYAQEGLEKLKSMKAYKGDDNLRQACISILNFYVKEGEKMKDFGEYTLAKEKFESIKKEMEKEKNKTQQQVDAYNKAVNEINAASGKFNQSNKQLNEERQENISNWNKAVKAFFDEHTPHYK